MSVIYRGKPIEKMTDQEKNDAIISLLSMTRTQAEVIERLESRMPDCADRRGVLA